MNKKFIFLIYNPVSGNISFSNHLDYFIKVFQTQGYEAHLFRTSSAEDFSYILWHSYIIVNIIHGTSWNDP